MIKNICRLESVIENKVGHFFLDQDTPLHIAKEMLFQFQKYIGQIEDQIRTQQEADKAKSESFEIKEEEPKAVE